MVTNPETVTVAVQLPGRAKEEKQEFDIDTFIAKKNNEEIIVARKKRLLIQEYPTASEASKAYLKLKGILKEEGFEIVHLISEESQEEPRVKKMKKVRLIPEPVRKGKVMRYKVVLNNEEEE